MKKTIVIGGGIAGMQAALTLKELGLEPVVLERNDRLGGKLLDWDRLFPTQTPASEVLDPLVEAVGRAGIEVRTQTPVASVAPDGRGVVLAGGERLAAEAVVVATGFELFDARLKEEYGYGVYPDVITSAELEAMFKAHRVVTSRGKAPERVAILHCVGSRDEKVGQNHCSRVCCITGVKQAVELRQLLPGVQVSNFYMDMRMFGAGYEEIYRESQEKYHVNHIRGRISEVGRTREGRLALKTEDTLVGRPMRLDVDLLVLLVGMCAAPSNKAMGLPLRDSGFFAPVDPFGGSLRAAVPRVFFAGTATAPKNVSESLHEGTAAAHAVCQILRER